MKLPRPMLGNCLEVQGLVTSADVETNVHLISVLGNAIVVALDICIQ